MNSMRRWCWWRRRNLLLLIVQLTLLFYGAKAKAKYHCYQTTECGYPKIICTVREKSIRAFIHGDWGGSEYPPYTTKGQLQCADFISNTGPVKQPQFFAGTGDNFYYYGVKSVTDHRFKVTFDDVFQFGKNDSIPWYMVAGNHDWYGDVGAQILYSRYNDRWKFPHYSYAVRYDATLAGWSADFVFIDTIQMCGGTWDEDAPEYDRSGKKGRKLPMPRGPKYPHVAYHTLKWIDYQLATSRAKYLFVVGHYPIFSATQYRISECLYFNLQPLLEKYRANVYFSGHEHNLQHLTTITPNSGGHCLHHVISGAGHLSEAIFQEINPNRWDVRSHHFSPKSANNQTIFHIGGIVYMNLTTTMGVMEFFNCDGTLVHTFQFRPRLR